MTHLQYICFVYFLGFRQTFIVKAVSIVMSSVIVDVNLGPVARFVHPKLSCRVNPFR